MSLLTSPRQIVERAEASGNPGLLGRAPTWARRPVSEMVQILNGAPFKSARFNTDGRGLPLIRIRDVGAGHVSTYYEGEYDPTYLVRPGALLVGMDGDFRVAPWTGPKALLNQRVCRLDIQDPDLDPRWLRHILQGYLDAIWTETSSVTVKHISSRSIGETPIPVPPIDEQRRIVEILEDHLSRLNAADAYLDASLVRLNNLRRAWLSAHLQTLPGSSLCLIKDVLIDSRGGWSRGKRHEDARGRPYLKMNNITGDGRLALSSVVRMLGSEDEYARYLLRTGDVLFNSKNSGDLVGKTAVATRELEGWTFNENIMRLRFADCLLPEFAGIWFQGPMFRAQVRSATSASTNVAAVYLASLRQMSIWVPPANVQVRLAREYDALDQGRHRLAQGAARGRSHSKQLRRALLHAAFTGRLTGHASDTNRVEELAASSSTTGGPR